MILNYCVYSVWFLSEILLNRLCRSGESDKKNADKNTLLLLWIVIILSLFLGMVVALNSHFYLFKEQTFSYTGLVLILTGMVMRLVAVKQLGKFFTVDVTIRKGHQLMKNGFYKYVRHPSYTGSLLSFIGYGISLNNYVALATVLIPVVGSFIYRINIEEKALTEQFGQHYSDYKSTTKRLIPFIY